MGKDKRPLHKFHYRPPIVIKSTADRNLPILHSAIQAQPSSDCPVVDAILVRFACPQIRSGTARFGAIWLPCACMQGNAYNCNHGADWTQPQGFDECMQTKSHEKTGCNALPFYSTSMQTSNTSNCITYLACMKNSCISSANSGGQPKSERFNRSQFAIGGNSETNIEISNVPIYMSRIIMFLPGHTDSTVEIRFCQDTSDSAPAKGPGIQLVLGLATNCTQWVGTSKFTADVLFSHLTSIV